MIATSSHVEVFLQAILLLGAVSSLGQGLEHCEARGDDGIGGVTSLALLQKAMTKTKYLKGYSLPKENRNDVYSLLQESQLLSKTQNVWDEDDDPSLLSDPGQVDPIEMALETLNVPVKTNAAPWPMIGAVTSPPPTHEVSGNAGLGNVSLSSQRVGSPGASVPPVLRLKKDSAVPLQETALVPPEQVLLMQAAEATLQPPEAYELVDPPSSLLQQLPLQHLDRRSLSGYLNHTTLPRFSFYTMFYVMGVVGVMLCVACVRSSTDVVPGVSEDATEDVFKIFYDGKRDQWIQVEVLAKLKSGQVLMRELEDSTLLVGSPAHGNLRAMNRRGASEPTISFPPRHHHGHHGSRAGEIVDIVREGIHWRLKVVHNKIVEIANVGRRRRDRQKEGEMVSDTDSSDNDQVVAGPKMDKHQNHLWRDVEEDAAIAYLEFEDVIEDVVEELEELGGQVCAVVEGAAHIAVEGVQGVAKEIHNVEEEVVAVEKQILARFKSFFKRGQQ